MNESFVVVNDLFMIVFDFVIATLEKFLEMERSSLRA